MSTKTYFKRISLAVILALSFGALSSAPSQSALSGSSAITLSAATDSKIATETSSVTVTASFTSTTAGESLSVRVTGTGAGGTPLLLASVSDSANISTGVTSDSAVAASNGITFQATAANTFTRVKLTFRVTSVANVGSHIYTVNLFDAATSGNLLASTTYTLTVAAANTDATAAQSQLFLNESVTTGATYIMSDSANLVKSAGQTPTLVLMTPQKVAYLFPNFRNSAGESVVATTGANVSGTMTVKITSGPGLLSKNSDDSTKARQFDITRGDSISIWNDGPLVRP